MLQDRLLEEFAAANEAAVKPAGMATPLSHTKSRLLKSIAGLAIIATVGWMPLQRLFEVSSVEAVVNAHVVMLRAPIAGTVEADSQTMRVGGAVKSGDLLTSVSNERADKGGADRAAEALAAAREELAGVEIKIARTDALRSTIVQRLEAYRTDRIARVAADMAETDAMLAAAEAVLTRADSELKRQKALSARKVGTSAARETAQRDQDVANAGLAETRARRASLEVEAQALEAGRFFGDSYNDQPRSAQRLDELDETGISLKADRSMLQTRVARLETAMLQEKAHLDFASRAPLTAPIGGQIWEVFTSPGEEVAAGQPLISVLDCSNLLVTAAVSEAVYNSLSVGRAASFALSDGGAQLPARIVQLSGVAAAASNLAIVPSALTRESYRVSVSVDGMSKAGSCPVGQTGRVIFSKTPG